MDFTIEPNELARRHQAGESFLLLDVRTPMEFQQVHIPFARNLPLDLLNDSKRQRQWLAELAGQSVYVVCHSGTRGGNATEKLRNMGIAATNVSGGTKAWIDAGHAVTRGRGVISLDRQVRIGAGSLVLLGVALGLLVHPGFLGISAFVGAGLIFAGVTDSCGMAMLLARMPWNKTSGGSCSAPSTSNLAA